MATPKLRPWSYPMDWYRQGLIASAARIRRIVEADIVSAMPRPMAAGELADGEQLPLMRLRYGGSAHRWGTAIYVASMDGYQDQVWFTGTVEDVFDLVCDLHVTNADS